MKKFLRCRDVIFLTEVARQLAQAVDVEVQEAVEMRYEVLVSEDCGVELLYLPPVVSGQ